VLPAGALGASRQSRRRSVRSPPPRCRVAEAVAATCLHYRDPGRHRVEGPRRSCCLGAAPAARRWRDDGRGTGIFRVYPMKGRVKAAFVSSPNARHGVGTALFAAAQAAPFRARLVVVRPTPSMC